MARIISFRRPSQPELPAQEEARVRAGHRPMRPAFIALVTGTLLVASFLIVTIYEGRAGRELDALPPQLRHDLYVRTLDELRGICLQPIATAGTLRGHCLEQARFVERMSECAGECRSLVSRVLPPPAR
jgi:hypothetical protein